MDSRIIHKAALATLAGSMPFPTIIGKLIEAGVEYYHVDYIAGCTRFYDGIGTCVITPIPFEGLPPVAAELDVAGLRENIRDSQQKHQTYRDFTVRAMKQGVQGYFVFLRGKRVTYLGRTGDHHVEWFPGAGIRQRKTDRTIDADLLERGSIGVHMPSRRAKAKAIQQSIRQVLLTDWSPIPLGDSTPEDEYDACIAPLYRILTASRSEAELVECLYRMERELGVSSASSGHLHGVAARLLALDVR